MWPVFLMESAQVLLLQNWIAGFSELLASLLVQFLRVPQEEQMMLDHIGEAYRQYMQRTGYILPHL
jgi:protein-S-isoprenylcysteine O-methyltransferase Ste14